MLCLRSSLTGLAKSAPVVRAPVLNAVTSVRHGSGGSAKVLHSMGQTASPSLHSDIAPPSFADADRKGVNWKGKTNRKDRVAENNLPSYMVIGGSAGVVLYMAKYALYGAALLLGPGRDKYAAAAIEVDLSTIPEGKNAVFMWRGKPLFIRHRTTEEIDTAQNQDLSVLRDPQPDATRCTNEKYLICLGVCTHLGCVPIAHAGDWKGYYCPCHGSHYDTCARIMKGPAPLNLEVPKHEFLAEELVVIGKED